MRHKILYSIVFCCLISGCSSLSTSPSGAPANSPAHAATAPATPQHTEALLVAIMALDTDYRYGGHSFANGFDCSGLVAYVFKSAWGLELPHNSRAQSEIGTPIDSSALRPGDLVFYNTANRPYSHVGIYLGDGKFIHAPRTGARVRIESLHKRYWARRYDGARRIDPPTNRL
jgi:cell wall-associated NlpC family hydrolase